MAAETKPVAETTATEPTEPTAPIQPTAPVEGGGVSSAVAAARAKHAILRYATLRLGIFVVSLGVLWGVVAATGRVVTGNGALYLCMGALIMSGVASFFLLNRQRDAMSAQVTARAERMTRRVQANASMEDED